jgi:photosystem II stability/assembly factor-like uncharacterized protein
MALVIYLCSIFISHDARGQWQSLGKPGYQFVAQIASLFDDSVVLEADNSGLYRTTDGGITWLTYSQIEFSDDITFKNDSIGWIIGGNNSQGGVLKTIDAGLTWNLVLQSTSFENIYYEKNDDALFALAGDSLGGTSSFVSLDEGATWRNLHLDIRSGMSFSNDQHAVISSQQGGPPYRTSDSLIITNDGGVTWQMVYITFDSWQPAFIPGTDTVIAPNDVGGSYISYSTDGGYTWNTKNFDGHFFSGAAEYCDCAKSLLVQDTTSGIYMTTDVGSSWTSLGGPGTDWFTKFFYSGQYIYAGNGHGEVWRYAVHHYPTITYPGPLQACSTLDTSFHISFTNTCFGIPASLDSFALTGSPAFSLQPLTTPFTLANEQDIGLHYNSTPGSHDTAYLYLKFNQHGDIKDTTLTFTGSGTQPDLVLLHLVPSANNAVSGKTFNLGIYPNQAISDAGLDTISFMLHYWNDLLNYIPNSSISAGPISVQNGEASLPITIVGTNISLDPAAPITTLMFEAMLTDTTHTTLMLTDATANPSDGNYASCVLSLTSDSTPFQLDLACGDSTILAAWNSRPPFSIEGIQPNPASSSIEINLSSLSSVTYTLFDALGRSVLSNSNLASSFSLDVSNVPSGIYYLRVSSNGYIQSRSISITR